MARPDHISIRRVPPQDRQTPLDNEPATPPRGQRTMKDEKDLISRYRIIAVLIAVSAALLLIALLSYTSKDEANAELTMRDVMGVMRGDDALRVKFETTHNWLGLLGAVLSHWFYHSTIGIWSICFPVLMMFWSYALYTTQRIHAALTRQSIATISFGIALASLIGSIQAVPWMPAIPPEGSGAIGQFFAGVISQLIGVIGSVIVMLVSIGFILVFGFNVNLGQAALRARLGWASVKDRMATRSDEGGEEDADIDVDGVDDETNSVAPPLQTATGMSGWFKALRPKGAVAIRTSEEDDALNVITSTSQSQPPTEAPGYASGLPSGTLSGSVRILRPRVKTDVEDDDRQSGNSERDVPRGPESVNLSDVERRLATLHPDKSIKVRRPAEHIAEDELPLFAQPPRDDDEDEEDEEESRALTITRPLTLTVQETDKEPEVTMRSSLLYDEEIKYKSPKIDLLVPADEHSGIDDDELKDKARILQEKLETFRIKIENLTVQPGPVVTQYEFVPAAGIKVSQIESLADDIALALKAQGVRIIAPIPGRGTVGIEIPNLNPAVVRFSEIIKSPKYHNPEIRLPIAMGKTVVGEVYCADLTKMPHLLIAGATGKGKSVGINTIIASLLYKMHPRDLKFVIIDPKRVEMTLYTALKNHFMAVSPDITETIITEPSNAVLVLKSVVEEMQQRYSILAAAGQRNIADFNRKAKDGTLKPKSGFAFTPMPYIVVIIDELADLMMTASKEVEEPIVRLAQLARAVGIHCVVATQRPSVDVVTGLIKANFPARIAYQTASRIDSRTILDASGAEHLIGNGDMLFNPGNMTKPIRMQNAFISTEEVESICEWIGKQRGFSSPYILPSVATKRGPGGGSDDDRDVLFEDAARIFIQLQQASVSTLQRRLKVGYARAARIVDELEMAGIVGPPDGSKGRIVLLQSESELEAYL